MYVFVYLYSFVYVCFIFLFTLISAFTDIEIHMYAEQVKVYKAKYLMKPMFQNVHNDIHS